MADKTQLVRKDLFGSSFKTDRPDKNDSVVYPEVKGSKKIDNKKGKANSIEANNGQNMRKESMEDNTNQNTDKKNDIAEVGGSLCSWKSPLRNALSILRSFWNEPRVTLTL